MSFKNNHKIVKRIFKGGTMLPGLTEEQNEWLRSMHVAAMDELQIIKKIEETDKLLAYKLGLATFTQAKTYLELGNFESDPRFPK